MNQGLKQRLVGTLVLLALAVILAPVLFNFDERSAVDTRSQIPPPPAIEAVPFSEPQRPDDIPEREEAELFWPEAAEELPAPIDAPPAVETTGVDNSGSAEVDPMAVPADAWVIQVGTFSEQAGADALLQTLLTGGYKAYRRSQFRNGAEWYLIFVGPVLSRTEADRQKAAIEREHNLEVLLRRFSP